MVDREHATASQMVEDLVAAAAAGDVSARRELFARYWPMIRQVVRACRARAGAARAADDTDDVAQEVAIALLQSLPKQRWQGRQAFRAWLKKLAAARVVDAQRYHLAQRRDRRAEAVLEPALMAAPALRSPESRVDEQRQLSTLVGLLERLDPQYAGAVMLHHLGYSHEEVGEILECSAEAARKLVARGEAKLVRLAHAREGR